MDGSTASQISEHWLAAQRPQLCTWLDAELAGTVRTVDALWLHELAWAQEFISPDPAVRGAAIARNADVLAEHSRHQDRANDVYWRAGGTFSPQDPALTAELKQIWAEQAAVRELLVWTPLFNYLSWGEARLPYVAFAQFAVTFLKQERLFPDEWGNAWHTKRHVLRALAKRGPTRDTHDDLLALLQAAIHRVQRAEDGGYVKLARTLDRTAVLRIIRDAQDHDDANVRQRAGYVRWILDNPHVVASLASWRQWQSA